MPTVRSSFVNPLLTDIFVGYGGEQNYIAGQLFPTVEVDKETGIYFVRDKENLRTPADARRGEFARANRVTNTLTQATYTLEEKTLEHAISERVMRNSQNPFDPKKNGIQLIADKLKIDKEKDLQATILGSGAPGLAVGGAWGTITTDIVGQVRSGRDSIQKNTGKSANVLVLAKDSYDAILKNTAFIEAVKYTSFASEGAQRSRLAEYFDVDRVIIGNAIENTAKEGQADVLNYIWSDNAILLHVTPTPALEVPTAGYELKQAGMAYADEWYEQEIKSWIVRASDFYDNKIVDPNAMYLFTNTV